MASMNDMTQVRWNGAGIKAHTITKVRWFLTTDISSTLSIGALSPTHSSRLDFVARGYAEEPPQATGRIPCQARFLSLATVLRRRFGLPAESECEDDRGNAGVVNRGFVARSVA
jgi:hypothetical protein